MGKALLQPVGCGWQGGLELGKGCGSWGRGVGWCSGQV